MHTKALRLIKQLCIHYKWSWELKKLLDLAIYTNSSSETLLQFLSYYQKHSRKEETKVYQPLLSKSLLDFIDQ